MNQEDKPLDFGDYCWIEQKRFGVPNEWYQYKVIGRRNTNAYSTVPANPNEVFQLRDMAECVLVIRCGIDESRCERFRAQDVRRQPPSKPATWAERQ